MANCPAKKRKTQELGAWRMLVNGYHRLHLVQYREAFADAAVDGAFLMDLNDADLRNTLGIDHSLHRKKLLIPLVAYELRFKWIWLPRDKLQVWQCRHNNLSWLLSNNRFQLRGGVPQLALQPQAQGGGTGWRQHRSRFTTNSPR